jgi:hypothetical protein
MFHGGRFNIPIRPPIRLPIFSAEERRSVRIRINCHHRFYFVPALRYFSGGAEKNKNDVQNPQIHWDA